jgi:hypothetical protein
MEEVDDKAGYVLERVGPAVIACDCDLDVASLRSALWAVMGQPNPVAEIVIEIVEGAATIELPANTPWRNASKRFTREIGKVWLVVGA